MSSETLERFGSYPSSLVCDESESDGFEVRKLTKKKALTTRVVRCAVDGWVGGAWFSIAAVY